MVKIKKESENNPVHTEASEGDGLESNLSVSLKPLAKKAYIINALCRRLKRKAGRQNASQKRRRRLQRISAS